jgi:hypothetical protein
MWAEFWLAVKEASRPDPDAEPTGRPWTPVDGPLSSDPRADRR